MTCLYSSFKQLTHNKVPGTGEHVKRNILLLISFRAIRIALILNNSHSVLKSKNIKIKIDRIHLKSVEISHTQTNIVHRV